MEEESFSTEEIAAHLKRISRQQDALSRKIRKYGENLKPEAIPPEMTEVLATLRALDQDAAFWLELASQDIRRHNRGIGATLRG